MNERNAIEMQTQPSTAVVGCGYWGKNLARNFLKLGALHTLCDPSEQILAGYGVDYCKVKKEASFQNVISNPRIDKIVIAAPALLHYELATAAAEAGKDVFVEKPLCLNIYDAERLVKLAKEKRVVLMVGHLLQYHPCIEWIQEDIKKGNIGEIYMINSTRLNFGKIRREENALWSLAPHDVSVILSLMGGSPNAVQCNGGAYINRSVVDTALTQICFPNSARACVHASWLNPYKEQKLTIVGSDGMIVFDDTKPWSEKLIVFRECFKWGVDKTVIPSLASRGFEVVEEKEPLQNECLHFLKACAERSNPKTNGDEGIGVLRLLTAAQSSLELGGVTVRIDN